MLEVRHAFRRGVGPESYEGAQQLRVGASDRHVELCGSGRHARHLSVDRRIGEDQASSAEQHAVEALDERAVQGDLRGQNADVLNAEIHGAVLTSADDVGWVRELDLENKIELGRQHLATAQKAHQGGCHEHFLEMRLGQSVGKAADLVDFEALVGLFDPPLARLQQGVQVHAAGVLAHIVGSLIRLIRHAGWPMSG